jgi:hypothetical protein
MRSHTASSALRTVITAAQFRTMLVTGTVVTTVHVMFVIASEIRYGGVSVAIQALLC